MSHSLPPHQQKSLLLENYFPYQMSMLSKNLADALENYYGPKHGLTRSQWRVLALIGQSKKITAVDIVELASLDRVAVHRAVSQLIQLRYVDRVLSNDDRRVKPLNLTKKGKSVYEDIVPVARAFERKIYSQLSKIEIENFLGVLEKLMNLPKAFWTAIP